MSEPSFPTQVRRATLHELGWRLRHHCAARSFDPDRLAERVGLSSDDFALLLAGQCDLPFSTLSAVLDQLDLDWHQLFGADVLRPRRTHQLTLESDAWQAMAGGLQLFDVRQDVERYRVGDCLRLSEKGERDRTGRVLTMEVTYLLYLASLNLLPGHVAMALRPVATPQVLETVAPLTEAQKIELQRRLKAYETNPDDRRTWNDLERRIAERRIAPDQTE